MARATRSMQFILMLWVACRLALAECPTEQEAVHCGNLASSDGFTYQVPEKMIPNISADCEHGWYHSDGTFIADSTATGTKLGFVLNLTINTCINLQWQLRCEKFCRFFNYTVKQEITHDVPPRNATFPKDKKNKDMTYPDWQIGVSVGIGIMSVIILPVAIWFCSKKHVTKSKTSYPAENGSDTEISELSKLQSKV